VSLRKEKMLSSKWLMMIPKRKVEDVDVKQGGKKKKTKV